MIKVSIESLYAAHEGQRCLLLGNGPSLETFDLSQVAEDVVIIGMHRTWRLINPKYHVILRRVEYFQEILDKKWSPHGLIITKRSMAGTLKDRLSCHVAQVRSKGIITQEGEINFDLSRGSSSVMCGQLAMELAVWMSFSTIYLIGYDLIGGHAFMNDPEEGHHMRMVQKEIMAKALKDISCKTPSVEIVDMRDQPEEILR